MQDRKIVADSQLTCGSYRLNNTKESAKNARLFKKYGAWTGGYEMSRYNKTLKRLVDIYTNGRLVRDTRLKSTCF